MQKFLFSLLVFIVLANGNLIATGGYGASCTADTFCFKPYICPNHDSTCQCPSDSSYVQGGCKPVGGGGYNSGCDDVSPTEDSGCNNLFTCNPSIGSSEGGRCECPGESTWNSDRGACISAYCSSDIDCIPKHICMGTSNEGYSTCIPSCTADSDCPSSTPYCIGGPLHSSLYCSDFDPDDCPECDSVGAKLQSGVGKDPKVAVAAAKVTKPVVAAVKANTSVKPKTVLNTKK